MTYMDRTLAIVKKTHIKGIKWWLWLDEEDQETNCPFNSKACYPEINHAHKVCKTLFPKIRLTSFNCPCDLYEYKTVVSRAKKLVKLYEGKS